MNFDTPPRSRKRGQVAVAAAIALIAVGAYILWPSVGMVGVTEHDFGTVEYEQSPHVLEHVFVLTNTSSSSLQVMKFSSTCGCAQATGARMVVEPGEDLLIPVTLRLSRSGDKDGRVTVHFYEGGSVDLTVRARAKPRETLRVNYERIRLRSPSGRNTLRVGIESDTKPDPPTLTFSDGLKAEFLGWEKVGTADPNAGQVPQWAGHISLQALPEMGIGEDVRIEVGGERVDVVVNSPRNPLPPTTEPTGPSPE